MVSKFKGFSFILTINRFWNSMSGQQ